MTPAEFEALGRHTVLLIAVWTQKGEARRDAACGLCREHARDRRPRRIDVIGIVRLLAQIGPAASDVDACS